MACGLVSSKLSACMAAALRKAAKRGAVRRLVPITVAPPSAMPSAATWPPAIRAASVRAPAMARPRQSRTWTRPRSRTGSGRSSNVRVAGEFRDPPGRVRVQPIASAKLSTASSTSRAPVPAGGDRGVRRDDDVGERGEGIVRRGGLLPEHVEPRPAETAALQRLDQGRPVHDLGARDVDQHRARLHPAERGGVDHVFRLGVRGKLDRDEIRALQ